MHLSWKLISPALAVFLLLAGTGCGEAEEENSTEADLSFSITDSSPVSGWLDVLLPGVPVAMDATDDQVWILIEGGIAMNWNSDSRRWNAYIGQIENATDIVALENGAAVLTPGAVSVLEGDEINVRELEEFGVPLEICGTVEGLAVLLQDGSVLLLGDSSPELLADPSNVDAAGSFCTSGADLAWLNTDGTASVMENPAEGLVTVIDLPEGTERIDILNGSLIAVSGGSVYTSADEGWAERAEVAFSSGELYYTREGIRTFETDAVLTTGLPVVPEDMAMLEDGSMWVISDDGTSVWCELGDVETRLPEADVQRLTCTVAGQVSGGSDSGDGVAGSGASLGGVFRIYESVSSRPDPFTEIPATTRDLRRPLDDISIEELHLVGITIDPSGGDQAMVEDANGVAYILQEGTVLKNNTRIAEITGNEVIVVQEVVVGSEDDQGGTASIPTIFSMRLHEEGGL
ncbi:hypothetical protein CSA37_05960 [Candidatus Fermentibacteria bacterium]|nr:MAG: hypothetical protein CSA37_05960 [Candidatus Fermentibacteria bacterium]